MRDLPALVVKGDEHEEKRNVAVSKASALPIGGLVKGKRAHRRYTHREWRAKLNLIRWL